MAVITSFDLKGNKQSFASWISNLSPCDTPFTSMIGKEGITQAQYSWQTDTLAPADNNSYEEGSQFVSQTRPKTQEITNFTSILRATASVSSTAEAVATYGRGSELAYQMTKAGKELMRDLEWMNLSNVIGRPGTDTQPSRFAGFEGLVAGLNMHDGDTGAVVHKELEVSSNRHTCIDSEDIFDMTYNLYLSGSKADKIMFHPKHAIAFAMLMGEDSNQLRTYRMFEGLDDKFNLQVKKIRDPLGRTYTLIPNRYVPEDKIYFFNEADWTQMILRAPKRVQLAKNGASETHMIEMEVGLRHKHPFASGVLSIKDVNVQNTLPLTKLNFTTNIGEEHLVNNMTLINGHGETGMKVHYYTSDPTVVSFEHQTVETDKNGMTANTIKAGIKRGIADIWTVCRGVRSEVHTVICSDPTIGLTADNENPTANESVAFTAIVLKSDLTPVGAGIGVKWFTTAGDAIEFAETESHTDDTGTATVNAVVKDTGEYVVNCYINRINSNNLILNYIPQAAVIEEPVTTPDTFGIGDTVTVTTDVFDDLGNPLKDAVVNWSVFPQDVATPASLISITDDNGIATVDITGAAQGEGFIVASINGLSSEPGRFYVGTAADMEFSVDNNPATVGEVSKLTVKVTGHDGSPIRNTRITFNSNPPMTGLTSGRTNNDGIYEDTFTPLVEGSFDITAIANSFSASQTLTLETVDNGFNIPYTHSVTGHTGLHTHSTGIPKVVTFNFKLHGMPEVGKRVECFSLTPELGIAVPQNMASDLNGNVLIDIFGVGHGVAKFSARAVGNTSNSVEFEVNIGSPTIDVVVTPTTQTAGKDVEFSAAFKDANDNWIPDAEIEWVYPPLMLANATTLPTEKTDQYGRVYFVRKAGAWGTHTFHARAVANTAVRSRDHKLTSVL